MLIYVFLIKYRLLELLTKFELKNHRSVKDDKVINSSI